MNFALLCFYISRPYPASRPLVWFYILHPLFVSLLAHSFCDIWICILFILPFASSLTVLTWEHPSLHFRWQSDIPCRDSCYTLSPVFFNPPPQTPWTYFAYRAVVKFWHTTISKIANTFNNSRFLKTRGPEHNSHAYSPFAETAARTATGYALAASSTLQFFR